jgi:Tfp pilus assembly protein FimV
MRATTETLMGLAGLLLLSGCRTAARVTEVPRVDLELSGGNRGYLVGAAPEATRQKTTRQMVETTVEIPSFYKPKRSRAPVSLDEISPPEVEPASQLSAVPGSYDSYVVQKGDSLWSIAAKPEVYGKASLWKRLLDANQDVLKGNADRLRPGMTLKIPRGADGGVGDDEGTTYHK